MSAGDSYAKPLELGEVVYGQAVGTVIESCHEAFRPGDLAVTMNGGWQEYSLGGGAALNKVDLSIAPEPAWLGILGTSGMTAYVGLMEFGAPSPGETVLVSAASGAVGSVVGQLAKLKGCRAVGIAGGAEKCGLAVEQYGFDACVDYRSSQFPQELAQACPDGVDVSFENVGGLSRDAAWPLLNMRARVVVCGLISEYNDSHAGGPGWFPILTQRLSVRGFILSDHIDRRAAFERDMSSWYSKGLVTMKEDVRQGLEQVVPSFIDMLEGRNLGKTLVRL